jgi:hypothetical protein
MTDYYKHRYETIQIAVADDYGLSRGYWVNIIITIVIYLLHTYI